MAKTTTAKHPDYTGTKWINDQIITPRSTSKQPNLKLKQNNAKHTNLLGYEAKSLCTIMVVPEESKWEISCAYELAILGDEPSQAFLI